MEEKDESIVTEEKTKKQSLKERLKELESEHEDLKKQHEKLKEELRLAKEAAKESMEMVKNFKMDVDRIKERSEKLNAQLDEKLTSSLVQEILPTIDNFEKAFKHLKNANEIKGFKMICDQLEEAVKNMKVKKIEVVAGIFDPNRMEAIATVPTENQELEGTVQSIIQEGYYYEPTDKVIRYTQVAVYKYNEQN